MDYSQFLIMRGEISLLLVFLLIFLFDTFGGKKSLKGLSITACVLFALHTVWNIIPADSATAFGGMYQTSPIASMVKTVLNIGTLIVLLQSVSWSDTPDVKLRRGEFYELLLVTLFGMYLMVSSGHFLLFFIGLETASLPMAALIAINKKDTESYEAGAKYLFTAVFSSAVFLLGLSFLYGVSGSLYFGDIAVAIASNHTPLLIATLVFVLAGMGFKLSLDSRCLSRSSHSGDFLFVGYIERGCCFCIDVDTLQSLLPRSCHLARYHVGFDRIDHYSG